MDGRYAIHRGCPMSAYVCTCTMTDPKTWLSAASCGYGSGYEPGSQWEYDPDCPEHGIRHWCAECEAKVPEVEVFHDQIGFEERAQYVVVTRLDCGHEIVRPAR